MSCIQGVVGNHQGHENEAVDPARHGYSALSDVGAIGGDRRVRRDSLVDDEKSMMLAEYGLPLFLKVGQDSAPMS
jgi:hypothetical protein